MNQHCLSAFVATCKVCGDEAVICGIAEGETVWLENFVADEDLCQHLEDGGDFTLNRF